MSFKNIHSFCLFEFLSKMFFFCPASSKQKKSKQMIQEGAILNFFSHHSIFHFHHNYMKTLFNVKQYF